MIIRYSQLCSIREIINKYDIDDILECGAPSDEYYDLVDNIIDEINICDEEHINNVLINMFSQGTESSEEYIKILQMAKDIYEIIKTKD